MRFALRTAPNAMEELRGIAQGFGMAAFDLFCGWYAAALGEIHTTRGGCTAVASGSYGQTAASSRTAMCRAKRSASKPCFACRAVRGVAAPSLASPALAAPPVHPAASMKPVSASLTQIGSIDRGVGLIRYILMQQLLTDCRNVPEALAKIKATQHTGGGALVIADIQGRIAAVELGHRVTFVESIHHGTLARTNHFTGERTSVSDAIPLHRGAWHR